MKHYIIIAALGTMSLASLEAAGQETTQPLDSLLRRAERATGYFAPRPIADPALRDYLTKRLGEPTPLVDYLQRELQSSAPSIGTYTLLMPLIPRFDRDRSQGISTEPLSITADSLRLFRPKPLSPLATPIRALMPRALGVNLALREQLHRHLQSRLLGYFDYLAPSPVMRPSLALAGSSDAPPSLGTHAVRAQSMEQVVQSMQIQQIGQRYWVPSFESSVQFSQSHVSDNWYKGGSSNLNLYMRTYAAMTYLRGKIKWKNELEDKLSIYNMDKSDKVAGRGFRVADDQIRLRSNFGLKAVSGWYYTLDAEARSQLLTTYKGDTDAVQSSPLAPLTFNAGLGMRFDYTSKSKRVYQRKLVLAMNFAPISYTYRSTIRRDIDLARHGLAPDRLYYHRIGSTLKASMQWDINMNVSWVSKLYFNTSYTNIEAEWENTLDMKIGRYLSTRINLQLRYDDAARPSESWNRYLQYNELLSFGFSYKL